MRQVASNSPQENLELAFATAEQQLGVTRLLDPEGKADFITWSECGRLFESNIQSCRTFFDDFPDSNITI